MTDDDIQRMVWARVQMINEGLEHYEQVRKVSVLNGDFPQNVRSAIGFLQKRKVDRKEMGKLYQREIEEIYSHPLE